MATADTDKKRHYFPALDGLRALAALWVLAFHVVAFFPKALPGLAGAIAASGFYGVDIFFCLSGFLLAAHHGENLSRFGDGAHRAFLKQRLLRLYPLHLAVLLAFAVAVQLPVIADKIAHSGNYSLSAFVQQIFLVSAWRFPIALNWNHPAWAVSAEFLLYLLAPFYFLLLKPKDKWPVILALVFVLLTPLCVLHFGYSQQISYGLPRTLCGFGFGVLAWRWREKLRSNSLLLVLAIIITTMLAEWVFYGCVVFAAIPFFALLVSSLIKDEGYIAKALRAKPLQILARLSYALYLTQYPVLLALQKLHVADKFGALVFWPVLMLALSLTTLAGYYFVEKLFLRQKEA